MKKRTLSAQIIEAVKANPSFDPMQISEVLAKANVTASPAYCSEIMLKNQEKMKQAGIDLSGASTLEFEKVNDPEKKKATEEAGQKIAQQKNEKEKPPRTTGKRGKEPTKEDLETLEKAKKMAGKPDDIMNAVMSGKARPIIEAAFRVENSILKTAIDYEHDEKTIKMLVDTWEPFLDKYLNQLEGNQILYAAILSTVVVHIPVILKLVEKYGSQIFDTLKGKPHGKEPEITPTKAN